MEPLPSTKNILGDLHDSNNVDDDGEVSKGLEALNKLSTTLRFLETEKSTTYYSFRGPRKTGAQLQIGPSEFVPPSMMKRWDSVTLSVNIIGGEIAPRLQLTAIVGDADRKTIHEGFLSFFPCGTQDAPQQILNPTLTKVRDNKETDEDFSGLYKLTFQSCGGTGSALNLQLHHRWDADTLKTFAALRGCAWQAVKKAQSKMIQITLHIRVTHHSAEASQKLWNALEALTTHNSPSWFPYLRRSDLPEIMWNSMLDPDVLYKKILPIAYPFTISFADVVEAEIKLGYSAWIEALYKRNILNQLKSRAKNVRFLHVAKRVVLAKIELDLNSDGLENLRLEAGTPLAITWTPLGAEMPMEANGFTIDNWMGLQDAQVLVLLNGGYGKLWKTSNPPMATPFAYASQAQPLPLGSLAVAGDEADIRRQISAVHTLCDTRSQAFSRWWPLLLNQDVNGLEKTVLSSPSPSGLQKEPLVSNNTLLSARNTILNLAEWNEQQIQAIQGADKFTGGCCLIEGPPGTGKTKLFAALAAFYLQCGLHVLMTGPTDASADAMAEQLRELISNSPNLNLNLKLPLRVYRPQNEERGLWHSQQTLEPIQEATQMQSEGSEDELALLELLLSVQAVQRERHFRLKDLSLQAQTIAYARTVALDTPLMCSYPLEGEQGPQVNLWAALRAHLDRLATEPLYKWEAEEKNKFKFEWHSCCKEVISNAPCVICTDSTAGSELLRSQVGGRNPKGIIIMQDEAGMEMEARTWVPITKLQMATQVVGIVMVGDRNQLGPLQLSKGANINEFGLQSSHSLYDRLLLHNFPSTQLSVQYRMHPDICSLVNKRIYQGRLVNDQSVQNRTRDADWDAFLKSWLPVSRSSDPIFPSLIFLNVTDGIDVCGQLSHSRSNIANVNVVASLLRSWYEYKKSNGKPKLKVVILVPYKDQKILYQERLLRLAQSLGCRTDELVETSTIDGFQGREGSVVILDLVRTKGLGFLEQEPRATVAFSRCRDSLIVVGHKTLAEELRFQEWKDTKKTSDGVSYDNPKPSVICYIEELARRNLVFDLEGGAHAKPSLQQLPVIAEGGEEKREGVSDWVSPQNSKIGTIKELW